MTGWNSSPESVGAPRWVFPPPLRWPHGDIIAVGGDLEPATLVAAYRSGIFPMPVEGFEGMNVWWSPNPRGIIPLDTLRVTRSLRRSVGRYETRVDTRFVDVVRACAEPSRERGWITEEFVEAYSTLHRLGWAHSVEAYDRAGQLAGGLYGVRVNGLFAGESMFYTQRDASIVALMALVQLMRDSGMKLLDVQWCTAHLQSLGAIEVSRDEYLRLLADAIGT